MRKSISSANCKIGKGVMMFMLVLGFIASSSISFASYGEVVTMEACGINGTPSNNSDSTGGNSSTLTEGTGSGYNSDPNDNTWSGYDHDVGLDYLKIGKKSSSRWKGSKVWSMDQIPNKKDCRVKLKRKGGKWKNVCAEVWFSHNKYFTDDDKYLGKECKKLSKKKYRKKKVVIKI